jgi:ribosomal-protein-alanine N-acetyltransferase
MQTVTSQQVIIRRMQSGDINVVTKIENAVAIVPWDQQLFAGCLKVYDSFVAVISDNNNYGTETIIGFGVIAIYHSIQEAHILNLGVDKDRQRMGVGELLLQHLIDLCKEECDGCLEETDLTQMHNDGGNLNHNHNLDQTDKFKIFLEVNRNNQAAINLYKKFNFVEVGLRKNYYLTANGREDALVFCLYFKH